MASVYMLGDGTKLCDKHLAEQFPGRPEPETGWIAGECDTCSATAAARILGHRGGLANTHKQAKARAQNGKKGGRPRKSI